MKIKPTTSVYNTFHRTPAFKICGLSKFGNLNPFVILFTGTIVERVVATDLDTGINAKVR